MPVSNVRAFLHVSQGDEEWLETEDVLKNPEGASVLVCIFHRIVICKQEQIIIVLIVYVDVHVLNHSDNSSPP